ncbi:hypothetical protein [Prauserella flavalba]|uniref:Uncharacterized protein n=1 Tax=Prauserella flavalba TaxID=1477506 RepID=A0A318LPS7_9PSEU|nr:hypothetical protein [Prauserella flavalba]PXY35354.1 hypothetical protein BA062_07350 [Prauserella flavalba]
MDALRHHRLAVVLLLAHLGLLVGVLLWAALHPLATVNDTAWVLLTLEIVLIIAVVAGRSRPCLSALLVLDVLCFAVYAVPVVVQGAMSPLLAAFLAHAGARLLIVLSAPVRRLVAGAAERGHPASSTTPSSSA